MQGILGVLDWPGHSLFVSQCSFNSEVPPLFIRSSATNYSSVEVRYSQCAGQNLTENATVKGHLQLHIHVHASNARTAAAHHRTVCLFAVTTLAKLR